MPEPTPRPGATGELRSYGLETFAWHLYAAGRSNRLLALFENDKWIGMRRAGGDAAMRGLRSDIDLAWQVLQETDWEAGEETAAGLGRRFVNEIRIAAVRSTLGTLSTVPVEFVLRAVETGLWPVDYVLTMTADRPAAQQIEVCVGLLELSGLDGQERRKLQRASRDLVIRSGEELSAWTLITLCRQMDPGADAEIVRARLQLLAETANVEVGTGRRTVGWDPVPGRIEAEEVIGILSALPPGQRGPLLAKASNAVLTALYPDADRPGPEDGPATADAPPLGGYGKNVLRSLAAHVSDDLSMAEWLVRNLASYLDEHPDLPRFGADLAELLDTKPAPGLARAAIEVAADRFDPGTLARLTAQAQPADVGHEPSDTAELGRLMAAIIRAEHQKRRRPQQPWQAASELQAEDPDPDSIMGRITEIALKAANVPHPGPGPNDFPAPAGIDGTVHRIALFAVLPALTQEMPADRLRSLVRAAYVPRLAAAQYDAVDGIYGIEPDVSPEGSSARRVVRGELLCAALRHAVDRAQPLAGAWRAIPPARIPWADLTPVLAYLRTLPPETTRHQLNATIFTEHYDQLNPPLLLQALDLVAPYLPGPDCEQLLTELRERANPQLWLDALVVLAPRLDIDALADALSARPLFADALQQSWALGALTADDLSLHRQVSGWRLTAITNITSGTRMGEELAEWASSGGHTSWQSDLVYQALAAAPPNRQLDALVALGSHLEQELDYRTARLVLDLPAVDDTGRYSWRALGIQALASRLPTAIIPGAWTAAGELPTRMRIGHSEAFGWDWTWEFARAAAMHALIPCLPEVMLRTATRDAQELSWAPRRAVLTALAERADTDLAGIILDSVLDCAMRYSAMPDSGPPSSIEGVEVFEPLAMFKARREVDTAELIAVLASKLDHAHLTQAVRHLATFTNEGPRAWLPGRLLPYLDSALRAEVLPRAVTCAMGFVMEDPTRFDLLTSLLPDLRNMLDDQVAPIRDLVHRYFPGRHDLLLASAERETMTPEDRAAYEGFLVTYTPDEALHSTEPADPYAFLESMVSNPLLNASIERVLAESLLNVPLPLRTEAMPKIAAFLPEGLLRQFAGETVTEIFQSGDSIDKSIEMLTELLPFVSPELNERILQLARAMPAPDPQDLEAVGQTVYHTIAREFLGMVPASRSAEPMSPGMQARDQTLSAGTLIREIKNLAGPRSWLLQGLARKSPEIRSQAYDELLACSDAELVHAIPALMPVEDPELRSQLVARAARLQAGFARAWVLWQLADELTPDEIEAVEAPAQQAARAVTDSLSRAVAWLTVANLRTGVARTPYFREALSAMATTEDADHLVQALSGMVTVANDDPAVLEPALVMVLDLTPGQHRARGIALVADPYPDLGLLPDGLAARLNEACCQELRRAATENRAQFLTTLANLPRQYLRRMPDHYRLDAARAVQEVCTTYHWI